MGSQLDVVGIGNAIVDAVAEADDALLAEESLHKGSMTLIDVARARALRMLMGEAVEVSGGSAANTMVGVARLGGVAGYVGKVRDDAAGRRVPPRYRGLRRRLPHPGGGGRCRDRAVPDLRHPRCPAHDEHVSGRLASSWALPISTRTSSHRRASSIWRATSGTRRRPKRPSARRSVSPMPRAGGSAFRSPIASASSATGRNCAIWWRTTSMSCSRTRTRRCHLRGRGFRTRLSPRPRGLRHRRADRSAKGSVVAGEGAVHTTKAALVDHVVDTTGAGDLYAAGFPSGIGAWFSISLVAGGSRR